MDVSVVFYKDGKIVGIDTDYASSVKAGRSANLKVYYPYDSNYDTVEFDDFKVIISSAYVY